MFDFSFSEEEDLVAETAARFAERELRSGADAADLTGRFDDTGLRDARELGDVAQARVIEALAWGDAGATVRLMAPALSAQVCAALGAPAADAVHVVEELDDEAVVVGWAPCDADATLLVMDPGGRWRLGAADLQPARGLGLHAAGGSSGVVGAGGEAGEGDGQAALAVLHRAAGAMLAGVSRASLEYTCGYVQERRSFGRRLADHQGLAFLVADMAIRTEAARWAVFGGLQDCWSVAADAACWVTDQGVQLLGGHGYMKAHPVERFMRDARALALCWGGRDLAWT